MQILKTAASVDKKKRTSAREFLGIISQKDIALMESAIEQGCEQINPDEWN